MPQSSAVQLVISLTVIGIGRTIQGATSFGLMEPHNIATTMSMTPTRGPGMGVGMLLGGCTSSMKADTRFSCSRQRQQPAWKKPRHRPYQLPLVSCNYAISLLSLSSSSSLSLPRAYSRSTGGWNFHRDCLRVRGGAESTLLEVLSSSGKNPVSALFETWQTGMNRVQHVALLWAVWCLIRGVVLSAAPSYGARLVGGNVHNETTSVYIKDHKTNNQEDGPMRRYLLEAIGVVQLAHGVALLLAMIMVPSLSSSSLATIGGSRSLEHALGWSFFVRWAFLVFSFLSNTYGRIQSQSTQFMMVNTAVLSWVTLSLLKGLGQPLLSARVFASGILVKGSMLLLRPVQAAFKFFGVVLKQEENEQQAAVADSSHAALPALCRWLGYHLFINAVLIVGLATGQGMQKAMRWSALAWSLLLIPVTISTLYVGRPKATDASLSRATQALPTHIGGISSIRLAESLVSWLASVLIVVVLSIP